jgi:hypothetical protein
MSSTPALLRAGRSCSKSTTEGLPPGPPHLFGKALEPHQIAQALLDGQLEVLPEKGPVDIFLIGLDDGIGREDEPCFVHGATVPDYGRARRPTEMMGRRDGADLVITQDFTFETGGGARKHLRHGPDHHAPLHDEAHPLQFRDVLERIAVDRDQVGVAAGGDAPDPVAPA